MPHASSDSESERVAFGRKRADSSSSRESSPGRPRQKRSFSPTSDDGDLVVPQIPDDDTPPPENRPLIRQALGFTEAVAPSVIQTYEYSSVSSTARKAKFLPGQSVEVPPEPKKRPKKRERKGTYGGHTGRFRLTDVPPLSSPNTAPPPTTTQFNSYPIQQPTPPTSHTGPGTPSGSAQHHTSSFTIQQPSPTPTLHSVSPPITFGFTPPLPTTTPSHSMAPPPSQSYHSYPIPVTQSMSSVPPSSVTPAAFANASVPFSLPQPGSTYNAPPENRGFEDNISIKKATEVTRKDGSARSKPSSSQMRSPPPQTNSVGAVSSYYRRNYDDQMPPADIVVTMQSFPTTTATKKDRSTRRESQTQSNRGHNQSRIHEPPPPPQPRARRMVTLLIADMRSGREDDLLAEVIVPIRPVDYENKEAGFWVQAEDVVEELQQSTSRIEGDAKVFAMRGKYRQIFMRVTWDRRNHKSTHEVSAANLAVTPDRTLQLIVVAPPKNESLPSPVRIPQYLRTESASPEPQSEPRLPSQLQDRSQNQRSEASDSHSRPEPTGNETSRKRQRSPSNYSPSPPSPSPSRDSKRQKLDADAGFSDIPESNTDIHSDDEDTELIEQLDQDLLQSYDSPESDDEEEEVESRITERVDCLLQTDEEWTKFFGYKTKPKHVPAMLQQYRFVKRMVDMYEGRRVPFRSVRGLRIKMVGVKWFIHILKALNLDDDPKFGDDCVETMSLLELYGPEGSRLQDSRVKQEMGNDQDPEYNSKPIKRFLRLLRSIDEKWRAGDTETRPGNSEPVIRGNESAVRDE
ncbi:hypothetical protein L218DRAFT_999590 [Marasmius fiardii PR-910]|nr:hypothetical protein L218DRAFT_999590 [Marasmius fiardii PR-910]